ncbi:MAG: outer membrane protein assembly factor BamD [bacterium]|nr:outer membrane protein assembly factor BamD [bacterium]
MKRFRALLWCLPILLLLAGCRGKRDDPVLRLSATEALELGKQFLEQEKYYKARQHLTHAFEVEPNSRNGREALLLAADAFFLHGGSDNYIKCEAKYRDFLNRFPTSDRADYAQFRVATCLARRVEKPDRDQKVTRDAQRAFEELLRLYPNSSHIPDARHEIQVITDRLAAHELVIGSFYSSFYGKGICQATIQRLEDLEQDYPAFSQMDAVHYYLGSAFRRCRRPEDADREFEKLRIDYPDSPFVAKMEKFEKQFAREMIKAAKKGS